MRLLLVVLALSTSAVTNADIIKCRFTEPFITTTYSMAQQSLTIEGVDRPRQVLRNISFQILGPGRFELWNGNRVVIQRMRLNFAGSDGMSDYVYPYAGQLVRANLHGGCTSNFLHATTVNGAPVPAAAATEN